MSTGQKDTAIFRAATIALLLTILGFVMPEYGIVPRIMAVALIAIIAVACLLDAAFGSSDDKGNKEGKT